LVFDDYKSKNNIDQTVHLSQRGRCITSAS